MAAALAGEAGFSTLDVRIERGQPRPKSGDEQYILTLEPRPGMASTFRGQVKADALVSSKGGMMASKMSDSRSACLLFAAVAVVSSVAVGAAAPNSCSFLTPAAVSAAIGQPVTGGTQSVVNDPSSSTSTCMYRAGSLIISLSVNQLPSAAAARAEYSDELSNSRSHDAENSAQKTVLLSGVGEGAFYAADGPAIGLTGVHGSFVIGIGLVGSGAASVPQERLRTLLQAALSHG